MNLLLGSAISLICMAGPSLAARDLPTDALTLRITGVSKTGIVTVDVINGSGQPLKVFRESNSWGAARWRVLILRAGQIAALSQAVTQIFTRNVPAFEELGVGAHVEHRLEVNDREWRGSKPGVVPFQSGDTIVAVYDVPVTTEARSLGVWYGVAAALRTVE
jgi:hypothetical protein